MRTHEILCPNYNPYVKRERLNFLHNYPAFPRGCAAQETDFLLHSRQHPPPYMLRVAPVLRILAEQRFLALDARDLHGQPDDATSPFHHET